MLADAELDIVIVATPNALHAEQSIAALKAGCHVLVEKPMATTLRDARAMIAAAKRAKKFLMVGHNQRLMAAHVKAKEILDEGSLGRVIQFQTSFQHGGPDGWSVDGAKSWFFKQPLAVIGACGDLGVHKADLIMFLLGEPITQVTAMVGTLAKTFPKSNRKIGVEDTAFITVQTRSGALGTIIASWTNFGSFEANGTVLFCENGVLEITGNANGDVVIHNKGGTKQRIKTAAVATNTRQVNSGVMDLFVDCILNNRPPEIDGIEGYNAVAVVLAAMRASQTGKAVKIAALT